MPPKSRCTWEIQATIPVLYTHQKVAKRPVHREGKLRLNAGRAVLCDATGKRLDEETVTTTLLEQLKAGEELDFPGHLLSADPPEAAKLALASLAPRPQPVPQWTRPQRVQRPTEGLAGLTNKAVTSKRFKRPRILEVQTEAEKMEKAEPEPEAEMSQGPTTEMHEQATPCRAKRPMDLRGVGSSFKAPRQTSFTAFAMPPPEPEVNFEAATPASSQVPVKPVNPAEQHAEAALELCRQAFVTERVHLERYEAFRASSQVDEDAAFQRSGEVSASETLSAENAVSPIEKEAPASPQAPCSSLREVPTFPPPCNTASVHAEALAWEQKNLRDTVVSSKPEVPTFPPPCNTASVHAEALAWEQKNLQDTVVSPKPEVPTCPPPCNIASVHAEEVDQTEGMSLDGPSEANEASSDEDDLPLSVIKANSRTGKARRSGASRLTISMRLPLIFGKCHVENQRMDVPLTTKASYLEYFEQALVSEMQQHLSAWSAGRCRDATLRVEELQLGPAKDDPTLAAMIFNRAKVRQGDLMSCAKDDLWVVLQGFGEALLFRSLWKGVTPKNRLLCAPVNEAAVQWLQQSNRLRSVTALCSGAFSSEFLQVDTLRQWAASDDHVCTQLLGLEAPGTVEPDMAPRIEDMEGLMDLGQEQQEVLRHVAAWLGGQTGCIHVHGVFGSGKSRALAASILMLHRQLEAKGDPRRILLLCQTNVAVDGVLNTLLQLGFEDFVRLGSFQTMHPAVLHRAAGAKAAVKDLKDALQQLEGRGDASLREKLQALQAAVASGELPPRPQEWRQRRLVATTSAALEAAELGGRTVPFCFVDEASQLTEPAIVHAFRKVSAECALLLGDPKQLPPRAMHPPLVRSALLRDFATKTLHLRTQYRCHPLIGNLCNRLFYEGQLLNGVTAEERSSALGPGVSPLAIVLSQGLESRAGQSYRHDAEARLCAAWLHRAQQQAQLKPKDFGVICLYRPHAEACAAAAKAGGIHNVDFATVDSFQGGEREVVALCCGRSTPGLGGSFCCPKRLNVAMSRARRHLVIFGTESFLSTHPIFSAILQTAGANGCVHHASEV